MPLPFVLSPYLRPLLHQGVLCVDNGVTESLESLSPLEAQVLGALWQPEKAQDALSALARAHGPGPVFQTIDALRARYIVFSSERECEGLYDQLLEQRLPAVPFVDQIELTNRCPMRCGFCPRGIAGKMQRPQGLMTLDLFEKLLAQLSPQQAQYRPLELHHLGESLLHPQVDQFIAAASQKGLPTELSVNPSLLTPELAARLLAAGLGRLVLSFDGMDEATMSALRGPAARFDKAQAHVQALLELAAARPNPPRLVIQMLALKRNEPQREPFLQRWGRTGLSFVEAYIKPLDGPDPDLGQPTSEPLVYLCNYPWRSVVVLWDGRVVPCCRDDDARYVLGDLNHQSLHEIWQGPQAKALRQAHRAQSLPCGHLCDGCAWGRKRFAAAMAQRHPDRATVNPLQW